MPGVVVETVEDVVLVPLVVRREARKEMPGNLATLKQHLERRGA